MSGRPGPRPGSGGVGFWAGGVSPSGGGDPHEDARLGLFEPPSLGVLASMVPSAQRAETALTRPAAGLVRDGVVLVALRGRAPAAGSGAPGRPGLDQMPQQAAWLVAWFLVAVITGAYGQWGDPDPESLEERSGQRVQRVNRLSWTCPPVYRPIPGRPVPARIIPRRSPPGRLGPPRAVRRWMMRPWAGRRWPIPRWPIPRWPILRWAFRSGGRRLGCGGRLLGSGGRLLGCGGRRLGSGGRVLGCGVPAACASVPDGLAVLACYRYAPPRGGVCSGRPGQLTGQLRVDRPECRHLTGGAGRSQQGRQGHRHVDPRGQAARRPSW